MTRDNLCPNLSRRAKRQPELADDGAPIKLFDRNRKLFGFVDRNSTLFGYVLGIGDQRDGEQYARKQMAFHVRTKGESGTSRSLRPGVIGLR